jgi:surface protein
MHFINNINIIFLLYSSNITIKIKKNGLHSIYNNNQTINILDQEYTLKKPDFIYINGINQSIINNQYNFENKDNTIKLSWNEPIDYCTGLFWDCSNITEIDLSEFNSSRNTQTFRMFEGCSSLTSINFANFDTSKVTFMGGMFLNCYSISSLDLSNFDTSKVIFMDSMFENCTSLTSLNLSNFLTSDVTFMTFMFQSCSKLEYLNIQNFITNDNLYYPLMFSNTPINLVICINENKATKIMELIRSRTCTIIDCSENWRKNRKKKVEDYSSCQDNCISISKYEYNGVCYSQCFNTDEYKMIITNEENFCGKICQRDNPFLLPYEQKCIKKCDLNDINKICFLTYNKDDSDDLMLNHIKDNLKIKIINELHNDIIIEEKEIKFIFSKLDIMNNDQNFEKCKKSFDITYNNIYPKKDFYILSITLSNDIKEEYEIYYHLDNEEYMTKLDLEEIDEKCYLKTSISKCKDYSIKSLIDVKCIS